MLNRPNLKSSLSREVVQTLSMYPEQDPRTDMVIGTGSITEPTLGAGRTVPVRDGALTPTADWNLPSNAKPFAGYQAVYNEIPNAQKNFQSGWSLLEFGGSGFYTNNGDGSVTVETASGERAIIQGTFTLAVGEWAIGCEYFDIDGVTELDKKTVGTSGGTATYSSIGAGQATMRDTVDSRYVIVIDVTVAGTVVIRFATGADGNSIGLYAVKEPYIQNLTDFTSKVPFDYVDPDFNEFGVGGLDYLTIENKNTIETTPASNEVIRAADVSIPSSRLFGRYASSSNGDNVIKVPIANTPLTEGRFKATLTFFYDISTTTTVDIPIIGDVATAKGMLSDSSSLNVVVSSNGNDTPPQELSIYDTDTHDFIIDCSLESDIHVMTLDGTPATVGGYSAVFPNDTVDLHLLCDGDGVAIKDLEMWDQYGG